MDSHRIYDKKWDIDPDHVREFYEKRARQLNLSDGNKGGSRYATVTLSDNMAEKWDAMEKELILPLLSIRPTDSVLDIGCGVGRWAESVIPLCRRYLGIDYSSEMVKACKKSFVGAKYDGREIAFLNYSFQDFVNSDQFKGDTFDVVLIAGVAMYINDDVLQQNFKLLPDLLAKNARIYLWESIGMGKRLTLDEIWSTSLNSHYSAVYRTREEYLALLHNSISDFDIVDQRIVSEFDHSSNSDTSRWYCVLKIR